MSRFDYVRYDDIAQKQQELFKRWAQEIEGGIDALGNGRAKSLALTKLEECYMWIGKQIRDDQIARSEKTGATVSLQEERKNG